MQTTRGRQRVKKTLFNVFKPHEYTMINASTQIPVGVVRILRISRLWVCFKIVGDDRLLWQRLHTLNGIEVFTFNLEHGTIFVSSALCIEK
jgi:hypothetical protein